MSEVGVKLAARCRTLCRPTGIASKAAVDGKRLMLQYLLKQTGFAKHPTTQNNRLRLQRLCRRRVTASSVAVSV